MGWGWGWGWGNSTYVPAPSRSVASSFHSFLKSLWMTQHRMRPCSCCCCALAVGGVRARARWQPTCRRTCSGTASTGNASVSCLAWPPPRPLCPSVCWAYVGLVVLLGLRARGWRRTLPYGAPVQAYFSLCDSQPTEAGRTRADYATSCSQTGQTARGCPSPGASRSVCLGCRRWPR